MPAQPGNISTRLRQLRAERGESLREVARAAELSPASLSAIENGGSSPTLATMSRVLKALGTSFAEFFAPLPAADESPVFPAAEMRTVEDAHRQYTLLLPHRADLKFEMVHETLSPAEADSEWETHECDVGGVILHGGPARLEIEGRGEWTLRRGDTFYVAGGQRHREINLGKRPLKQITVWYPPKY